MVLVNECFRIIQEANPRWWCLENPARGALRSILGQPKLCYQPYQYGSPWSKETALWGNFSLPKPLYLTWKEMPQDLFITSLWRKHGSHGPSLALLHKAAIYKIPEFSPFIPFVRSDSDFRSLCSQRFAQEFKASNP
jgi:hypothetical protein